MAKQINRRKFLQSSVLAGVAGLAATSPVSALARDKKPQKKADEVPEIVYPSFRYNANGKFKILQFTDTHYVSGDSRSARALKNVEQMLDAEKPDLVIHTGDVIYGKPAEPSLREILQPISDRKIPFAVVLGNHDEEYGIDRKGVLDVIRSIPYNVNTEYKGDLYGVTNDIITLKPSAGGDEVKWALYLFDSNRWSKVKTIKGYDWIHLNQIAWYEKYSKKLAEANGGNPVPAFAFFHIPIPEYRDFLKRHDHRILKGNMGEEVMCSNVNSGLYVKMRELGDVVAMFCGHDHDNDFALYLDEMFFVFGRFSGCDTVYNNLKPNGCRVIELTEGKQDFVSWIRLYGGEVQQKLNYPGDFPSSLFKGNRGI